MFPDNSIFKTVKVKQVNGIGQGPAGDDHFMIPLKFTDHPGEEVYMRRVAKVKPDFHTVSVYLVILIMLMQATGIMPFDLINLLFYIVCPEAGPWSMPLRS